MNQPILTGPSDINEGLGESIKKEITNRKEEKTKPEEELQAFIIKKSRMISKIHIQKSSS